MNAVRTIVRGLSFASLFLIGALGYSCATSRDTDENASATPAAAPTATKKADGGTAKSVAKTQVLPAPPKLTAAAAPEPASSKRSKKPAKQQDVSAEKSERVMRVVAAGVLNIRSKPSAASNIVGRLTRGSQLPVEIKGEWAKIGDSQYVQTKFLSAQGKAVAASK